MQRGLTAEIAAADADPSTSQDTPVAPRRARLAWLIATGLTAYLAALVATLPARLIFARDDRWAISGTVWNGEAVLDGAYRVEWRWSPARSLASLAFAADWRMSGAGTDIAGSATHGGGRLLLEGVSGQADGALLTALTPGVPFVCDVPVTVDVPRLLIAGSASTAEGEIRSDPGDCTVAGLAETVAVPALVAHAARDRSGVTTATLAPLATPRLRLLGGTLAGGRLVIMPTAAGEALLPFLRNWRIDRGL